MDNLRLPTMENIYACTRIINNTSICLCQCCADTEPCQLNITQTPTTPMELKLKPTCSNCGGVHLTKNCFQAGGVMEGKHDEVLASRHQDLHRCMSQLQILGIQGPSMNQMITTMKLWTLQV